jgi:hypothetical protein
MIVTNLLVGLPAMLLCLVVQVAFAFWSVRYYVRQSATATNRRGLLAGIRPLLVAMLVMMLGTLVQIALWGALFVVLGEFSELYEAIYHSAVNFASLGYGDIVMTKRWKLLGPLEAVNGVMMLGMSAAALMAILQQMIKVQRDALRQPARVTSDRNDSRV